MICCQDRLENWQIGMYMSFGAVTQFLQKFAKIEPGCIMAHEAIQNWKQRSTYSV